MQNDGPGVILVDPSCSAQLRSWSWPPFHSLQYGIPYTFSFAPPIWLQVIFTEDLLFYLMLTFQVTALRTIRESKQASLFQQVNRHQTHTQISKKRKGELSWRYINEGKKISAFGTQVRAWSKNIVSASGGSWNL